MLRKTTALVVSLSCGHALACLLVGTLFCRGLHAEGAGEYQAYPLKHKAAADVERVLKDMLAGMGDSTHLIVDAQKNQVLLRGPKKAQQIVRQSLESIDRPGQPARPEKPADAQPILRVYPCIPGRHEETVARLRSLYGDRGEVRVTADPQSGKILVLAPPSIHDEIPRHIPAPGNSSKGVQGEMPWPAFHDKDAEPIDQFVGLARLQVDQVETQLRELLGSRMAPASERRGSRTTYRFADASGRRVELTFDGQRNGVAVKGPGPVAQQFVRLIRSLDSNRPEEGRSFRLVPLRNADPVKVRQAVEAYRNDGEEPKPSRAKPDVRGQGSRNRRMGVELVGYLFQEEGAAAPSDAGQTEPSKPAPPPIPSIPGKSEAKPDERGQRELLRQLGVDVDIETLPDLDVIILRGRKRDVEEVQRIIDEIERISAETQPVIDIYRLRHISGNALLTVMQQVQQDFLGGRQGRVTVVPLIKPNALMLIGWGEAVRAAKEFISRLDQPDDPRSQQKTYHLRHTSAASVRTTLNDFFTVRTGGLSPQISMTTDPRTNTLIVQGAPRDLAEVDALIEKLDVTGIAAVMQTRIFRLENTLAADIYTTLSGAIEAARGGGTTGMSAALELLLVDPKGEKVVKSGILNDVHVTPDSRLNILIVSGPSESMDLIGALIRQLDSPGFVAQIKVFSLNNADAASMILMLRTLLPTTTGGGPQLAAVEGEPSTVGLRFSIDQRSNSIIAVGSEGNLRIIEALLLRLDSLDVQQRKTSIYRLKNSPSTDVANAINLFLRSERQVQQAAPGAQSPFQQIESEVVVVPEPVSNTLIISATPRFFRDIMDLVERLDAQPPQVMIQVLIAEVGLRDTDEFGIELGLQDSILFDRSVFAGNLSATQVTTTQTSTPAGIVTQTTQTFPGSTLEPGFNFNNQPLGNSSSARSIGSAGRVGNQGLSSFNLGRLNNELGFGGLVLSASSESINVLIRALKESQRLEVLGRPHIMTLDNQPAFIQIGRRVPRIAGTSINQIGQENRIELENVGLILGVTPRISPEGMVVMEIDAERSELAPEAEGIPISISASGQVIRSPIVNTTMAQTTVSASDGETIILGGLITKNTTTNQRKVPYLGDVPLLGNLFKYQFEQVRRTELLIVLTPHVVRGPEEMERLKRIESARMHWCLDDVRQIHGDGGLTRTGGTPEVIYPDQNPRGKPDQKNIPVRPRNSDGSADPREELPTPSPIRNPEPAAPPTPRNPLERTPTDREGRRPAGESGKGPAIGGGNPLRDSASEGEDRRVETAHSLEPTMPASFGQGARAAE